MQKTIFDGSADEMALRDAFAKTIDELIEKDSSVMYLDCDLMSSMGMAKLAKKHPENVLNCGIQEADMIGVASGLAAVGKRPFAHTFGIFATRRCYDQLFLSAGYAKNSIRVIGSDEGVTAAYNGGTHMPFEDMALIRAIPDSTVIDVTDCAMMTSVIRQAAYREGLTYIRTARKASVRIYPQDAEFTIGKGLVLRDGKDVTIIACGIMVATALEAADELEKQGISAAVIDMFTVKPLDDELVLEYAKKTGAVVTAENHNAVGGLGSAVSELLSETHPVPVMRVGVRESFGEVGEVDYLRERFGLTAENIVANAKKAVEAK